MFQGAIFDLDGVLVDSYQCWRSLVNEALALHGKPPLTKEQFDASWGQGVDADQQMFFPEWSVGEVVAFYNRRFLEHARYVKEESGARSAITRLKSVGLKLAVASNSPTEVVHLLLSESDLLSFFDCVVGVDQVAQGKPEPDMVFHALGKLQLNPTQACYVGDSIFDEQAARAAGVFFIGYRRPGDRRVDSLEELPALLAL